MKKYFVLTLMFFSFINSGCVPVIAGAAGIATSYVAFNDSVAGNLDTTFDDLWNVSRNVLLNRSEIVSEEVDSGVIKARNGNNDITVKIIAFTDNAYKLKVSCRRSYRMAANLEMAQDIFTRIVRALPRLEN